MLKIGLTGGVGSGKSTVAKIFKELGIEVIDADQIAKEITKIGCPAYQTIIDHFGESILSENKEIDRKRLRKIIFSDPTEKKWLETQLHPLIAKSIRQGADQAKSPYCIIVIPLLKEAGTSRELLDRILVVDTPIEMQLYRTQKRDLLNKDEAEKILLSQSDRKERLSIANDIILNDEGQSKLHVLVKKLHEFYLHLANAFH